nr:phage major capsid protein [Allomuricauda sp.]
MKTLAEKKQERAQKLKAQKALIDKRKGEDRAFTEDEKTEFRKLQGEISALDTEIEQLETEAAVEARVAGLTGAPVSTELGQGEEREHKELKKRFSLHKAVRAQLGINGEKFDGAEAELHQETSKRASAAGISINGIAVPTPETPETRADGQTVGEDGGAYGGNLVPETLRSPIEFLEPNPVLRSLGADFIPGLTGKLAFPTDDGGVTASWEGEVDTVPPSKTAFGKKSMEPNRLAVNVLISLENILMSNYNLEMHSVKTMNKRAALKIDEAGINGPGTGNVPLGVLNTTGINLIDGGTNGAAPTWDHLVDLETNVYDANAEASSMAYLINAVTKGRLKKTKHNAGDLGYLMDSANNMNGYKTGVSNLVPKNLAKGSGTNLSAAIFGDWSQLLIGQWGFMDLVADNITRKKDGYIELTLNAFLDVLVKQPKAFSVVKDWII